MRCLHLLLLSFRQSKLDGQVCTLLNSGLPNLLPLSQALPVLIQKPRSAVQSRTLLLESCCSLLSVCSLQAGLALSYSVNVLSRYLIDNPVIKEQKK